jgi:hypothetical protein
VKKFYLLLLLALLYAGVATADYIGVTFGANAPAGGGTDYTATIDYCWLMYDATGGSSAGALPNRCTVGSGGDMSERTSPPASYTAAAPSGSHADYDGAVNMDGTVGSSLTLADPASGDMDGDDFTLGCWYKKTANGDYMMSKNGLSREFTDQSGTPGFQMNGGILALGAFISTGAWNHMVVSFDGSSTSTTRHYVNGSEDCSGSVGAVCPTTNTVTANSFAMFLGSDESGNKQVNGFLYECFHTDSVLTQAQICEITRFGLGGNADDSARDTLIGGSCVI